MTPALGGSLPQGHGNLRHLDVPLDWKQRPLLREGSASTQPELSRLYENTCSAYQRLPTPSQNGPEPEEAKPSEARAAGPVSRGSTASPRHELPASAAVSPAEATGTHDNDGR